MQNRPYLRNTLFLRKETSLVLRGNVYFHNNSDFNNPISSIDPTTAWDSLYLMEKGEYQLKAELFDSQKNLVSTKVFYTDSFGNFILKIPLIGELGNIVKANLYETSKYPGIEQYIDTIDTEVLNSPLKMVICDFDRTLVDTRYSSAKEVYESITNPLKAYPTIDKSLVLLKDTIQEGFRPFILSASPHFYEKPIRDWLYQNKIFEHHLFLKDYRDAFSPFTGELSFKDISTQGFYKLDSLVDILQLTGLPSELNLIGDGFESDPIIYLLLRSLIVEKIDPKFIWDQIRENHNFKLNKRQESLLLNQLYTLSNLSSTKCHIKIYIRIPQHLAQAAKDRIYEPAFLQEQKKHIFFYTA